jgi:hypothetical protein
MYKQQIDGRDDTSAPESRADSVSASISQSTETGTSTSAWEGNVLSQDAWGMGVSTETPDFEKLYTRYFEM